MNILTDLKMTDEKPAILQLRSNDKSLVITIGLQKNQVLKRHFSATPALLVVLKGLISFDMEDRLTQLSAFDTFDIPANIAHEVTGLEESIFLLIKDKSG